MQMQIQITYAYTLTKQTIKTHVPKLQFASTFYSLTIVFKSNFCDSEIQNRLFGHEFRGGRQA